MVLRTSVRHTSGNRRQGKRIFKGEIRNRDIPCYYWLLCLLKLFELVSFNPCFREWVSSMIPESKEGLTVFLDGKIDRSTEKWKSMKVCYIS